MNETNELVSTADWKIGDEICKGNAEGQHCWHSCEMLLTDPPQEKQKCCWCNHRRIVRRTTVSGIHGKFVTWSELRMGADA